MPPVCTAWSRSARELKNEPHVRAIAEANPGSLLRRRHPPDERGEEPMASVDELVALAQHPKFVGIGETGLDYHYTAESARYSANLLRIHIEAAQETKLPLIIHARAADEDMARILTEDLPCQALYLRDALLFILAPNWVARRWTLGFICRCRASPPSPKARSCAISLPPPRLTVSLLETDSPYLAPPPHRGSAMNPPIPPIPPPSAPSSSTCRWPNSPPRPTANFDRLFWKVAA